MRWYQYRCTVVMFGCQRELAGRVLARSAERVVERIHIIFRGRVRAALVWEDKGD